MSGAVANWKWDNARTCSPNTAVMTKNKVLLQADALWRSQWSELSRAYWASAVVIDEKVYAAGHFRRGERTLERTKGAEASLREHAKVILESIVRAHATVKNVRSKSYSEDVFAQWCFAQLAAQSERLQFESDEYRVPGKSPEGYAKSRLKNCEQELRTWLTAELRQHFGIQTEHWAWHWGKRLLVLKEVPSAWYVAAGSLALAGVSIFWAAFPAWLRSLLGLH